MSRFWKGYASVSDDVRHELVERAWFGRQVTGDIDEKDMPGIADTPDPDSFYAQTRGEEPRHRDLYGAPVQASPSPDSTHPSHDPPTGEGPEPDLG